MIAGVAIISFSAIFVRLADVSPVTAAFFRVAYALPVLFALRAVMRTSRVRTRKQRLLAFGAGIAFAGDLVAWHIAIELIGAGLATVVGSVHVVTTMLAGWILLSQKPTRLAILATPVVMIGVALIAGVGSADARGEDPVLGVVFGALTAVLYTTYILLLRQAGTVGAAPVESLFDASVGAAVGALLLAPLDSGFSLVPTWPAHGWLILLALGAQVTGWLLINYTLPHIEAWEASLLLVLQPGGTILWAYLIFGEVFSISQWLGLLMVIVGVTTVTLARARSNRPVRGVQSAGPAAAVDVSAEP